MDVITSLGEKGVFMGGPSTKSTTYSLIGASEIVKVRHSACPTFTIFRT